MNLTREEERIYAGECGWANQKCIKVLVRLGELFDATRLIPINSAHVSGVSYKTLGDAPIEYLSALANAEARTRVKATHNPHSFDSEYLKTKINADQRNKQLDILGQFEKMGFTPSSTCTPYYLETPKQDSHLAWAESSAVVYANSILGAWTNREGGPSALAAAIIGKTPDYGIHRPENRQPQVPVRLEKRLHDETEFGALGIYLGKILEEEIPAIEGLQGATEEQLKQLCSAIASTGMVNMFHCHQNCGVLTDAKHRITVNTKDIRNTAKDLCTTSTAKPDLVFIGCPHCSINEIKQIADLIKGRKAKAGIEFWVCTSNHVKQRTEKHVEKIERSGGHVMAGVCTVVSWTEDLGIKTIMTNSAKTAYYAPTLNKAETILATKQECLKTALKR